MGAAGGVDFAALHQASPSTKNKSGKRDPDLLGDCSAFTCQAVDKGYASDKRKRNMRGKGVQWAVKDKAKRGRGLSAAQKHRNRRHGVARAKVEHVFRVLKCQFGYRKVRYHGLAKNHAQLFTLMALSNLYSARKRLRAESV